MRTFVQKPKATQQTASDKSTKLCRTNFGQSREVNSILHLQRTIGNQAVQRLLPFENENLEAKSIRNISTKLGHDFSRIQAKLKVSTPNDPMELEADRVADAIVRMGHRQAQNPTHPTFINSTEDSFSHIQRNPEENERKESPNQNALELDIPEGIEEDGRILPKSLGSNANSISALDRDSLRTSRGQTMPLIVQKYMGSRFGYDFSSVRVHTDRKAAEFANSINAAAFAHGRDIYFGTGRFDHNTGTGRRLLAHELTHVIQQSGGDSSAMAAKNIQRSQLHRPEIHSAKRGTELQFWRTVEAHVNLRQPQRVRIYDGRRAAQDFETSAGTGTLTSRLRRPAPYPILQKRDPPTAKRGLWGLQNYAWFTQSEVGFHSEIAYPRTSGGRRRVDLTVDGSPRSHGCLRLHHSDSRTVYNALTVGDNVHIYNESVFRARSWRSSIGSSSSSLGYIVQEGDTLSEIAEQFNVSLDTIMRTNGITDANTIRAGQELTVPAND